LHLKTTVLRLFEAANAKSGLNSRFFAPASAGNHQPPFLGRLPGFFLLRVQLPRSRLTFWPLPVVVVKPFGGTGLGAQMSASTLIFLGMKGSGLKWGKPVILSYRGIHP
jgi:hypothetical protein